MPTIHPTAIVAPEVQLGTGVKVGAYAILKGAVFVGEGTTIHEHSHVHGRTVIGRDCQIGPAAFVGLAAQHLRADTAVGQLIIGNNVTVRETATVHRSTQAGDEHATRVGDGCFMMAGAHVGHDAIIGNDVIMANGCMVGGHCRIGDKAFLGGGCAIHQFVRLGRLVIVGGNEAVTQEVPPFAAVWYGGMKGYNAIGCRRSGMSREASNAVRAAFRHLHENRLVRQAVQQIKATVPDLPEIREITDFIAAAKRGILPSVGGQRSVFRNSAAAVGSDAAGEE